MISMLKGPIEQVDSLPNQQKDEDYKKNQIEMQKIKNTAPEMNVVYKFDSRVDRAKKRTSELGIDRHSPN